jgi:2,5-dioxopentanoate dehydrogenase
MLSGEMFIGSAAVRGTLGAINGINPATGETLEPAYSLASAGEVERACALAWAAFDIYREAPPEQRAAFLERIAGNILDLGDELIDRAVAESGLAHARIAGERGRTVGQLRLFAEVVREGSWIEVRIDPAQPGRKPLPRSDIRQRHIAVGPVAVFGASNFPLAFSVAGGDTASALAAGCPVVVKAHPAHPGTSELVGRAVRDAARNCGMPDGVFSLLFAERDNAIKLVTDPRIKSVGFTGSRAGGMALVRACANRPEPIPVFAEMSSINPVFLLPAALAKRGDSIGKDFVASLTMGAGQFCTNPGLVLALDGSDTEAFLQSAAAVLQGSAGATMLTPGIFQAYERGVAKLGANDQVRIVARGQQGTTTNACQGGLFLTESASFLSDPEMQEEIFGASSLIIRCKSIDDMRAVAERLEGQLTATIQMEDEDAPIARQLLPVLERKAGRILVNGYPTGVEVCHAMVHGGPFPATSDARMTSVGTLAIRRFLRPVCYQDLPASLLPEPLKDDNPLRVWRRIDGCLVAPSQDIA